MLQRSAAQNGHHSAPMYRNSGFPSGPVSGFPDVVCVSGLAAPPVPTASETALLTCVSSATTVGSAVGLGLAVPGDGLWDRLIMMNRTTSSTIAARAPTMGQGPRQNDDACRPRVRPCDRRTLRGLLTDGRRRSDCASPSAGTSRSVRRANRPTQAGHSRSDISGSGTERTRRSDLPFRAARPSRQTAPQNRLRDDSISRAGSSVGFQNVCGMSRGLMT